MQIYDKKHFSIIIIVILCTILIILTNYLVTKQMVYDVQKKITDNEYDKIGGKDNYTILKEIQKEEILSYVNKLKQENPELIYKMRQNAIVKENADKKILSWEGVNGLKIDTSIYGNTGATISILEFSDFECSYCKEFHNNNVIKKVLETNKNVNYIFKNFPIPSHKNSASLALYAKCSEKIGGLEKYTIIIDNLFKLETEEGKDPDMEKINKIIKDNGIDEKLFGECISKKENESLVKKEFEEGMILGINSTPSSVIVDNDTGEYEVLIGNITEGEIIKSINSFLN